jgi:hypothetical protein
MFFFVLSLHSFIALYSHFSIRPSIPVLGIFLVSIPMILYILFITLFLLKLALFSFSVIPLFPASAVLPYFYVSFVECLFKSLIPSVRLYSHPNSSSKKFMLSCFKKMESNYSFG